MINIKGADVRTYCRKFIDDRVIQLADIRPTIAFDLKTFKLLHQIVSY